MNDLRRRDSGESDAICFDSVTVTLGGFPALLGTSFTAAYGDLIYLRGPNGAGKTTLLRTLAGLTKVTRGKALVVGFNLPGDERMLRRHVGLVTGKSQLYEDLTVRENLELVRSVLGLSAQRTLASQELFGVAGRLRAQKVSSLSAGQKKRVALCAMVMKNPLLWLLDEPHSSLDQQGRELLDNVLVEATRHGAVAVVASHEDAAATIGGARTLKIVAGKVVPTTWPSVPSVQEPNSAKEVGEAQP